MIPYFAHDIFAREDIKIKRLIKALKMEGYGIFWAAAEFLHNNANKLDESEIGILSEDLKVDECKLRSVLFDFKLFSYKNGVISSKRVAKNFKIQKEKSKKARESALARWHGGKTSSSEANGLQTQSERNAKKERKGKEIKEKERKENAKIEEKDAGFFGDSGNVRLNSFQYGDLLDKAGEGGLLNTVINEFSANVAVKKEKLYDEKYPEMHYLRLLRYLEFKNKRKAVQGKGSEALDYIKKLKEEGGLAPPPEFFEGKAALKRKLGAL